MLNRHFSMERFLVTLERVRVTFSCCDYSMHLFCPFDSHPLWHPCTTFKNNACLPYFVTLSVFYFNFILVPFSLLNPPPILPAYFFCSLTASSSASPCALHRQMRHIKRRSPAAHLPKPPWINGGGRWERREEEGSYSEILKSSRLASVGGQKKSFVCAAFAPHLRLRRHQTLSMTTENFFTNILAFYYTQSRYFVAVSL